MKPMNIFWECLQENGCAIHISFLIINKFNFLTRYALIKFLIDVESHIQTRFIEFAFELFVSLAKEKFEKIFHYY